MTSPEGSPESLRPTSAEIAAAIVLLADDRGPVQAAARDRLLRWGSDAVGPLREAAEAEHIRTRAQSRALLRTMEVHELLRRFAGLRLDGDGRGVGGHNAPMPLLNGAVHLAQIVRTFGPEANELARRLRAEARLLKKRFEGRSLSVCARLLAERLHGELGLHGEPGLSSESSGDDGDRIELDHVLVDRVLGRGAGIPVSLSLVYLLVARWAGLSAAGVALPDHFLVRLHGIRPVLVDPFHAGRTVTKADCARYLRSRGYGSVQERLRDLSDREFLIHYLRGLQRAARNRAVPEARQGLGKALLMLEAQ
ncbi:MAG: hypothetical protein H6838_12280 [Planctomycetes bacterium]|nr:transglutaminase family protein [Planctomycetota bacterium]MCB9886265.1 hypothetical protein [Planctomycetota bacterium]